MVIHNSEHRNKCILRRTI